MLEPSTKSGGVTQPLSSSALMIVKTLGTNLLKGPRRSLSGGKVTYQSGAANDAGLNLRLFPNYGPVRAASATGGTV